MKVRCTTCHGTGLIWRTGGTKPRARLNADDYDSRVAAFRCPTCPDDGSGNSVGTGWIETPDPAVTTI